MMKYGVKEMTKAKAEPITFQKIFDLAWQKFIVEDSPPAVSYDESEQSYFCRYKTEDGRCCAVGLALPDDFDFKNQNENPFWLIVKSNKELFAEEIINCRDSDVLLNFQFGLHDALVNDETGEWYDNLEVRKMRYLQIAEQFNLIVPPLPGGESTDFPETSPKLEDSSEP